MFKLLFFASLSEQVGYHDYDYPAGAPNTVAELIDALISKDERWQYLQADNIIIAINQTVAHRDSSISPGDEIAFYPPVSGG